VSCIVVKFHTLLELRVNTCQLYSADTRTPKKTGHVAVETEKNCKYHCSNVFTTLTELHVVCGITERRGVR